MVYAYAALKEGIPYANGRAEPDLPTCRRWLELAAQTKAPIRRQGSARPARR
jgi:hypothetical protein